MPAGMYLERDRYSHEFAHMSHQGGGVGKTQYVANVGKGVYSI
ncbi:MAG: hypothetical protein ACI8RA_002161 [Chlamydiales bacterium]|jgi:hypothetical protein